MERSGHRPEEAPVDDAGALEQHEDDGGRQHPQDHDGRHRPPGKAATPRPARRARSARSARCGTAGAGASEAGGGAAGTGAGVAGTDGATTATAAPVPPSFLSATTGSGTLGRRYVRGAAAVTSRMRSSRSSSVQPGTTSGVVAPGRAASGGRTPCAPRSPTPRRGPTPSAGRDARGGAPRSPRVRARARSRRCRASSVSKGSRLPGSWSSLVAVTPAQPPARASSRRGRYPMSVAPASSRERRTQSSLQIIS